VSPFKGDFFITKWWDRQAKSWTSQVLVGLPLVGLMENGLGRQISVGCCASYLDEKSLECKAVQVSLRPELVVLLQEMNHNGPVSFWFSAVDGGLASLETGIPSWGLYNLLEGVPGKLSEFFSRPNEMRLRESWTSSLVLSRYPWPCKTHTEENLQFNNLNDEIEKHFWLGEHTQFKSSLYTRSTLIGVCTSWARTMLEAATRSSRTAQNLQITEAQYRRDSAQTCGPIFGKAKSLGILE
jgi:hypothetical protein